ncbi:bifunctional proline dehydrogenase/L-glutamate gamma-semialdehyde dehydrogenase PutA [Parvularcula sp. ZS-1/3]|uniref:Bifunctional protein PutA n=1 Tax=Parvularcula mediterranea TaxID=2732508 RepID=A0A7Y3RKC9_9PROT|nr:bifunctional proline dehydrogenase/L-glutamate gamma-semialdehyde dehydrogenase PutA [Parvularcula mediterranea]NNU15674.1 bifunctional proline dehydrogenase/L-glutamate gamma-semialdehyde dehydrogenase PutA [Parvularcula mediterranea]
MLDYRPQSLGFSEPYAEADEVVVPRLMLAARSADRAHGQATRVASTLIDGIRHRTRGGANLDAFLREYGLSTKEGLALMVMAEALLRVPDAKTQDRLIEDKISAGDWVSHEKKSDSMFVAAAAWGLGLTNRVIRPGETPQNTLQNLVKRLGMPTVRMGVRQAMGYLGHQFVLGQTIEEALKRARKEERQGYRFSYDMLGEGARTTADADRYLTAYHEAIEAIGKAPGNDEPGARGISVKLSALNPNYHPRHWDDAVADLAPKLFELGKAAKNYDLNMTVDAEEAERLEMSLDVIRRVYTDDALSGWDGYGLAIQAYQKRAMAVCQWAADLAEERSGRMMVRLVKGAYWDTEIKLAQQAGIPDFPVFTRKAATDLSYIACASRLLDVAPRLYPQFATHNALTCATIIEMAHAKDSPQDFEFQRLHGMGESLYEQITEEGILTERGEEKYPCRIYAPVGGHRDLLAYLVRRLLENGANSSFVAQVHDDTVADDRLLEQPRPRLERLGGYRHSSIKRPTEIFGERTNSAGLAFGDSVALTDLMRGMDGADLEGLNVASIIGGEDRPGPEERDLLSPNDSQPIAKLSEADERMAREAVDVSARGFREWNETPPEARALALERAADLLEVNRDRLMAILAKEAGKNLEDGIAEIREAVDFCRFYAAEARRLFQPQPLPGPVGEENQLRLEGRGVFAVISPWNFPLAIFLGQTTAALAAGNAVVTKPAEQTPLIAQEAVRILHEAGIPTSACQLLLGDGRVGKAMLDHEKIAGVVFTGSTEVAKLIQRQLAEKPGPILPLIAETGGVNAMVVDATALPEQVTDDVVASAFQSAGQRCSALRVLYVQEDVADTMLKMIIGRTKTMKLGDPALATTDIGPIIDEEARSKLAKYAGSREGLVYKGDAPKEGTFLAPHIFELGDEEILEREQFGPILHVKRFKAGEFDRVLKEVASTGYGLTFGIHTRITEVAQRLAEEAPAGNVYVNRNQIGAIVGSQPFGGMGLSGTGPKAGGPHYLLRFAEERVISTNIAAAGGNASLIAMEDTE